MSNYNCDVNYKFKYEEQKFASRLDNLQIKLGEQQRKLSADTIAEGQTERDTNKEAVMQLRNELENLRSDFQEKIKEFAKFETAFEAKQLNSGDQGSVKKIPNKTSRAEFDSTDLEALKKDYEKRLAEFRTKCDEDLTRVKQEHCDKLQEEIVTYKNDLEFEVSRYRAELEALIGQVALCDEEIRGVYMYASYMNDRVVSGEQFIDDLGERLSEVKCELESSKCQIDEMETEIVTLGMSYAQQREELELKIEQQDILEGEKHYALKELEVARSELAEAQNDFHSISSQLKHAKEETASLREELTGMSGTLTDDRCKYEHERDLLVRMNADREQQMMDDYEWKLREIERDYKSKIKRERNRHEERLQHFATELEEKFGGECAKVSGEKEHLQQELDKVRTELGLVQKRSDAELKQVRGLVDELQKGNRAANYQADVYRNGESRVKDQLKLTEAKLKNAEHLVDCLKNDIADLKLRHDQLMRKTIEATREECEECWSTKLKDECLRLTLDLQSEFEEEKQELLETFSTMKHEEVIIVRDELKYKISSLHSQMAGMVKMFESKEKEFRRQITELETENLTLQATVGTKQELVEEQIRIAKMYEGQLSDIQLQLAAYRNTQELVRQELVKNFQAEKDQLAEQHEKQMERFKHELDERLMDALQLQSDAHDARLGQIEKEKRAVREHAAQREHDLNKQINQLKEEITDGKRMTDSMCNERDMLGARIYELSQMLEHRNNSKANHSETDQANSSLTNSQLQCIVIKRDKFIKILLDEKRQLIEQMDKLKSQLAAKSRTTSPASVKLRSSGGAVISTKYNPKRRSAPAAMNMTNEINQPTDDKSSSALPPISPSAMRTTYGTANGLFSPPNSRRQIRRFQQGQKQGGTSQATPPPAPKSYASAVACNNPIKVNSKHNVQR